jgi:hypothetical protein
LTGATTDVLAFEQVSVPPIFTSLSFFTDKPSSIFKPANEFSKRTVVQGLGFETTCKLFATHFSTGNSIKRYLTLRTFTVRFCQSTTGLTSEKNFIPKIHGMFAYKT